MVRFVEFESDGVRRAGVELGAGGDIVDITAVDASIPKTT